jgi:transmembrane sensor
MTEEQEHRILSYLEKKMSAEERQAFDVWQNESEENRKAVAHYESLWKLTDSHEKSINFQSDKEWEKLRDQISREEFTASRSPQWWLKAAASVIFVMLFGAIAYYSFLQDTQTIVETSAKARQLQLADGSEVWLNKDSRLIYSQSDFNDERNVTLEGEAFFKVTPNPSKPFIINTSRSQVKVLGTSFNVRAYEIERETQVSVLTGKVAFSRKDDESRQITLVPGQTGLVNDQGKLHLSNESDNIVSSTGQKIEFRKTPLKKVVHVLWTRFHADVVLKNQQLENCSFTGSFTNPTVDEIMETLQLAFNLKVTREDGQYVLDGSGCE